jgi:hypothetical protein
MVTVTIDGFRRDLAEASESPNWILASALAFFLGVAIGYGWGVPSRY